MHPAGSMKIAYSIVDLTRDGIEFCRLDEVLERSLKVCVNYIYLPAVPNLDKV